MGEDQIALEALQARYVSLLGTNAEQVARLTRATLDNEHLRARLQVCDACEKTLLARVKHLENIIAAGEKK